MFLIDYFGGYGFKIFLWLVVVALIVIFVYNCLSGKKGTYENHTGMIWDLFNLGGDRIRRSTSFATSGFESRGELECRRVAEKLTGKPFPKRRPNFLKNEITNSNLELDCFNEELMIAIEYNGEQHYNFVPHFHKTKDAFYNVKYRDEIKRRLCQENGVRLIVVPYTVRVEDIETYLSRYLNFV